MRDKGFTDNDDTAVFGGADKYRVSWLLRMLDHTTQTRNGVAGKLRWNEESLLKIINQHSRFVEEKLYIVMMT